MRPSTQRGVGIELHTQSAWRVARRAVVCTSVLAASLTCSTSLSAQAVGSLEGDRVRLAEVLGDSPAAAAVVRHSLRVLGPDVRLTWNSRIPYSLNDGPMWAGRGANVSLTAGGAYSARWGDVQLSFVLAPTVVGSQNRPFDIFPGADISRSTYSSPWHTGSASADLPLRFGSRSLRTLYAGQSAATLTYRNASIGITTADQWWGPGVRNALVMSNNAPGIPRLFLRTARPIKTRIGHFSAEWQLGTLTKSLYFDTLSSSDYRSFGGLLVTYQPAGVKELSVGLARTVHAPSEQSHPSLSDGFRVLRWSPTVGSGDGRVADGIASLFARWVFAPAGLEVYGEWARQGALPSLGGFLQTPMDNGGFTVGLQWAKRRARPAHVMRVQTELTTVEQSVAFPNRPPGDFYTGKTAPQGYTQRGQVIGAAIGPSASSQWMAVDYLTPKWHGGVFLGRTRWEENAMYRDPLATNFDHDVSVYAGLRGGYRMAHLDALVELQWATRYNYLFQNGFTNPGDRGTVDVHNFTLTTRLTGRSPRAE